MIRIPILGTPAREPDSGLKQFSRMKVNARPVENERQQREEEERDGGVGGKVPGGQM